VKQAASKDLLPYSEEEGGMFFRNVGCLQKTDLLDDLFL
jgi:hypothetical protein